MARTVLMVVGILLALFVLFAWVIPMVFTLLKVALIIGVIAVIVFAVVSLIGKSSAR